MHKVSMYADDSMFFFYKIQACLFPLCYNLYQNLPKFLFLFQTPPVFIPKKYFKEFDQAIYFFIWNRAVFWIRKGFL